MNALQELAKTMRAYAIAHPLDHAQILRNLRHTSGEHPFHRKITWKNVPLSVSITYLPLRTMTIMQLSVADNRHTPIPQDVLDDVVEAFFDPRDIVEHISRAGRSAFYKQMELPDVVGNTEQYMCTNPHMDPSP